VKTDIHPEYQTVIFLDTSCDHKILSRSTIQSEETMEWEDGNSYPVVRVEISSASHPFYTGKKQLIMDRGGRIEQFNRRYGGAEEATEGATEEAATEGGEETAAEAQA
jgi:large subunit ribosomal protein L31|tara:strand:- start:128 stop:451 length:324 start_codon:yes stop_codon:yes gene_type:complete